MLPCIRSMPRPATLPAVSSAGPGGRPPGAPRAWGDPSPQTPLGPASEATAPRSADGTAAGPGRLRAFWRRVPVKVGVLTAAAALLYCLDSLNLLRRFLASTFDLVIFDQGIRGYAHLGAPVSVARGISDGQGAHFLLLADHWSPMLALLAPLYWIHDSPATLLVAQRVLFALAIPPLWAYTRRQLGPGAAYFVGVAYALSLPVMEAVIFDFHEVAFVPVLTAVMVERFDKCLPRGDDPPQTPPAPGGAPRPTRPPWPPLGILAAVALLLVKEDMGLLVAGFGGYLLLTRRRWTGLAFVVGGVAATWVATHLLIPAFGGAALVYVPSSPFGSLLKPGFYNTNARMRAAAAAVAHVPAGVEVEASNNIGPALSGRDTVLLLDGTPRWAPWVVGDTLGLDFPFCTPSQQAEEVAYLRAHGYALVFADHGYVVLHRPADARTAQALAHPPPAARLHTDICY